MRSIRRRRFLSALGAAAVSAAGGCSEGFDSRVRRVVVRARRVEAAPSDATVVDAKRAGFTDDALLLGALTLVVDPDSGTPRKYETSDDLRITRGTRHDTGRPYVWIEVDYPNRDFETLLEQPTYDREDAGRFERVYVEHRGEPILLRYRTTVTTP